MEQQHIDKKTKQDMIQEDISISVRTIDINFRTFLKEYKELKKKEQSKSELIITELKNTNHNLSEMLKKLNEIFKRMK